MAVDLSGLGPQGFERLSQALALKVLGPAVRVFGAGPDGGREADFQGQFTFPNADRPWDGYGVLQAKFKDKITTTGNDTAWFIGRVKAEMDAWVDPTKRRVQDGRLPEYLIFTTNVGLSAVPRTGGKDRVDALIREYQARLPLKDWQVWDADQIITLLDCYPDVRRSFAAMITPNEVLAAMHDGLTAPRQTSLLVNVPPNRIRPGQPGNEAAFQPIYKAAGGAARLGEAISETAEYGPGFVQHFDGGPTGEPAVLCAPFNRPAIAVAQPVWNDLCAVGAGAVNAGVAGVGYPDPTQPGSPYLGPDTQTVELVGGTWGRVVNGTRRGWLLRQQGRPARWEPEIVFDSEASRDRDTWTGRSAKMDLRLCAAARIPLVADELRITEPGRARMLTALAGTTASDLLGSLATRYGLDPTVSWQETAEPEGRNDRRAASYHTVIPGDAGPSASERACG